jgi:arsenate reductase-like glutaredoxin family protein
LGTQADPQERFILEHLMLVTRPFVHKGARVANLGYGPADTQERFVLEHLMLMTRPFVHKGPEVGNLGYRQTPKNNSFWNI